MTLYLKSLRINGNGIESLMEHGVSYKDIALKEGKIDIESVLDGVSEAHQSNSDSTFERL